MKIFENLIKFVTGVFSIFAIAGYGVTLGKTLTALWGNPKSLIIFLAGIVFFTLLWVFYLSHRGNFWSTLEHELTHALFALVFFKKIHSISASRKRGGITSIEGGNFLIALSPYFFPLAAIVVLLVKYLLPVKFQSVMVFLLGFFYQFHLINLIQEYHHGQSDLQRSGFIFSAVFIIFLNLLFLGIILTSLAGDWKSGANFVWDGLSMSLYYASLTGKYLLNQLFQI